jgi:hypothetical protein
MGLLEGLGRHRSFASCVVSWSWAGNLPLYLLWKLLWILLLFIFMHAFMPIVNCCLHENLLFDLSFQLLMLISWVIPSRSQESINTISDSLSFLIVWHVALLGFAKEVLLGRRRRRGVALEEV